MFPRPLIFASLLAAAVGGPYLGSSLSGRGGEKEGSSGGWSFFGGSGDDTTADFSEDSTDSLAADTSSANEPAGTVTGRPLEGLQVYDLAEVIRTDISPNWVYQRWKRKSTALASLEYHGIRVPLVTGTRPDDIAGSLTYYFTAQGRCEKLVFRGRTGDTRRLVALVTQRHGFREERPELPGQRLYEVRWNGRAMSRLKIEPSSVLWDDSVHTSFKVALDLQHPDAEHYLDRPVELPMPKVEPVPLPTRPGEKRDVAKAK